VRTTTTSSASRPTTASALLRGSSTRATVPLARSLEGRPGVKSRCRARVGTARPASCSPRGSSGSAGP